MKQKIWRYLVPAILLAASLNIVACGSSTTIIKMDPYKGGLGYLDFEERQLMRLAIKRISEKIAAKIPTRRDTKVWLLSLEGRHDPQAQQTMHNILKAGFLRRGVWIGPKGKPAAILKKSSFLNVLGKAAALAGTKAEKTGYWFPATPKDPFTEKLFATLLQYGNSDNPANAVVEDTLIITLNQIARCTVLERDKDIMLSLAAHYLIAGKVNIHADPTLLKQKLALPDKILAYRITLLRKQMFTSEQRSAAGHPDRRTNRVSQLWVELHARMIDTVTGKIEWAQHFRDRANHGARPTD